MPTTEMTRSTCTCTARRSRSSSLVVAHDKDIAAAIEAHPEQMLDLLCRRPMPPAGREIGDAPEERKGHDLAVLVEDAGLALSPERGTYYRPEYVAAWPPSATATDTTP
jgi:hypothetical protein